jgi:hypothetical protein
MPAKSKHGRGKHPHNKKRSKIRQMQAGTGLQQQAASDIERPAAPVGTAPAPKAPLPKKVAASAAAIPIQHEYVTGELKRIGILTAIIVVILIVLYIFIK